MNRRFGFLFFGLLIGAISLTVIACGDDEDDAPKPDPTIALKEQLVANYADIVFASYEDSYNAAVTLKTKLQEFVNTPTTQTLQAAKDAWLAAREPYGQTEAYRFGDGPIDDDDGPEGLLNAWPLDESHIDYVDGMPNAGIINDLVTFPTIDEATLLAENENGGEENVSLGYHAIEFLLWGQDLQAPGAEVAGQRTEADYLTGVANFDRRGQYLLVVADRLLKDLQSLLDEWDTNGAYRATFTSSITSDEAIRRILTGIGVLGKSELAGERMFTAYDNQDQEDEHSCFADNTHRDIILNAVGIRNVYTGTYTRTDGSVVSGTSFSDLMAEVDSKVDGEMVALINASVSACEAMHVPFDNAITDAQFRPGVLSAVQALQAQGDKTVEVANALGITISTDLPE